MNIVNFSIKKREEFSWYKTSHRRFQLKLRARNLSKEQAQKLEKAIQKICLDILPDKEKE